MEGTRQHYETLLAPIYRWMLGDFEAALERSRVELGSLGIGFARAGAQALDLGAGLGLQSIPLAELGYRVTAIDTSKELLAELAQARPDVRTVMSDIVDPGGGVSSEYDVIVCMGDTLTHLTSKEEVDNMLGRAVQRLVPGGTLALTFRDYASRVLEGTDRFILVRADHDRILTCCLEFGEERVRVTDVVHERKGEAWSLRASAYDKVRLPVGWVAERLRAHGASVSRADTAGGRVTVVATR